MFILNNETKKTNDRARRLGVWLETRKKKLSSGHLFGRGSEQNMREVKD